MKVHYGFVFAFAGFLGGSAFIYTIICPNKFRISVVIVRRPATSRVWRLERRRKPSSAAWSAEYEGKICMTQRDFF